ncbi:MAG TPA: hypothetical protein VHL98_15480 [Microvirga sp.]|jgi:hypothetical protein|nr:hypothetical protein [Microvirga sp.]
MAVPVSALEVGKCYLTNTGRIWRIMQIMPDGRVLYEHRSQSLYVEAQKPGMLAALPAEVQVEREVPCDWTPEGDA